MAGELILRITDQEKDGCVRVELWAKDVVGDPFVVMVPRESLPASPPTTWARWPIGTTGSAGWGKLLRRMRPQILSDSPATPCRVQSSRQTSRPLRPASRPR